MERFVAEKLQDGLSAATVNRTLNLLSLILGVAFRRDLIQANPVALVDRPRETRRRWRILGPGDVAAVEQAFEELAAEADDERERDDLIACRTRFVVHMGTAMRWGEAAGLRWRAVLLADPDGPVLRIEETFVRHGTDTPKSEAGHRTISLGERVAGELWEHRAQSPFKGDDDYVFANPRTGRPFDAGRYSELFRKALKRAGISDRVRPSHDLRHSSITNAAAAGASRAALMSRSGHSSFTTTKRYSDLAGERFRDEAARLEGRLWGSSGTKNRYQDGGTAGRADAGRRSNAHDP